MNRHIRAIGITAVVVLLALFALLPIAGAVPRAATMNVSIKDFEFDPKTINVNVGDTVMWKNNGARPHTATATDGSFDSGTLNASAEFSFTFTKAGTFSFACQFHDTMQGTIVVADASAPAAQPAAPAAQPTGAVDVADQPIANNAITVANITAGQDGWIVVHLDEGGAPGKVIGQTAIKKGDNRNVSIRLTENVPAGGKLWPMLHIDAGAIGTYEFPGPDAPVIGADGTPVMKQISVSAAAAQPAQPAQPAQLPTTGGEQTSAALLLGALALLVIGATLLLRRRGA